LDILRRTTGAGRNWDRRPARYATEKKEFQQLIAELKRLSLTNSYSQGQIASEVGVSPITVNHLVDGAFVNGAAREHRTTEEVFGGSLI
jgi:hypothetical protein